MAKHTRLREALSRARAESDSLVADLETLSPADWERTSSCAPWTVRQLVAHVTRAAESYLYYIGEGLNGILAAQQPAEYRIERMNQIAAQDPSKIVQDLRAVTKRFEETMAGLQPAQLELQATHGHGPRPLTWFADQWLAELVFHHLDLRQSVGRESELDESSAGFLLPTLLEWNLPGFMHSDWPRGSGRFRLTVASQPDSSWLLEAAPGTLRVRRTTAEPADATIVGDAAALALLVYGRRTIADLEQHNRLRLEGDRDLAERFGEIFRGP